jgi:hypothetical protein
VGKHPKQLKARNVDRGPGKARASINPQLFSEAGSGKMRAEMGRELCYDLMLEVEGIMRSSSIRIRLDHELEPGELIDLNGRRWEVTRISPARSLHVDRRVVAREVLEPAAA